MAEKVRKTYNPNKHKNYKAQLVHMFENDYGFLGCNKTLDTMADSVIALNNKFYPKIEHLAPGKIVISAISKNESKGHHKGTKKLKQVPVQLEILSEEIVNQYAEGMKMRDIKKAHVANLFNQAYEQGGVLSQSDVAVLTKMSAGTVGRYACEYMKEYGKPLPTRGFVHDIGPSITHKEIIVGNFLHGKISNKIAKDTEHSQEATDRYIRDYERVKLCLKKEMDDDMIANATKMSLKLVNAYKNLYNKYEAR